MQEQATKKHRGASRDSVLRGWSAPAPAATGCRGGAAGPGPPAPTAAPAGLSLPRTDVAAVHDVDHADDAAVTAVPRCCSAADLQTNSQ